jgi:hypothetical protein
MIAGWILFDGEKWSRGGDTSGFDRWPTQGFVVGGVYFPVAWITKGVVPGSSGMLWRKKYAWEP